MKLFFLGGDYLKIKKDFQASSPATKDLNKQSNLNEQSNSNKQTAAKTQNKFSIKPYLKKHKWGVLLYSAIVLFDASLNVPLSIIPANMIVAATQANYILALKYVAIMAVIYICIAANSFLGPRLFAKLSTEISMDISLDVAEQSFKISSGAYSNHQTNAFFQRISVDPDIILKNLSVIVNYVGQTINVAIVVIYMTTINVWTSLILIVYLAIMMTITYNRKKVRIINQKRTNKANEKVSNLLNEIIRSERDIKSLNMETKLKDITKTNFDEYKKTTLKAQYSNANFGAFDNSVYFLFISVFTALGLILMDKGFLTLATFLILYNNRSRMDNLSNLVTAIINCYSDIKVAYDRINELYADDDYDLEKFGTVHRKNLGNDIEFKNVGFGYVEYKSFSPDELEEMKKRYKKQKIKGKIPKREVAGKKQVFEDLSFKIEPNTTVAFVGKSGCGKSTVLNLISKIYTVDSGKILIGGVDINKLDKSTLRSSISLVNQFPYIFDMTIKENLLLAKPNATDEEINQVIKDSALEEFIAELPHGIDTKVGESGIKLSGGQKQRLAIARALLKKSNVIILDESTSSLDNLAQNTIKESIDRIKGKSTIIIVAHRLSTIKNVDKIFFMENGKIVDTGSFEELNKHNKQFKIMYNAESIEN